jgi:hypothetical protein
MPLRLNVGVTRKVGLPEYSSVGASCHVEVELDTGLIDDPDGFQDRVRDAYVACQQAVEDELTLLQGQSAAPASTSHANGNGNGHGHGNGTANARNGASSRNGDHRRPVKPATANQVRAIVSIARRQRADLDGLLRDEFHVDRPEDLSLAQASAFIDQLKAASDV